MPSTQRSALRGGTGDEHRVEEVPVPDRAIVAVMQAPAGLVLHETGHRAPGRDGQAFEQGARQGGHAGLPNEPVRLGPRRHDAGGAPALDRVDEGGIARRDVLRTVVEDDAAGRAVRHAPSRHAPAHAPPFVVDADRESCLVQDPGGDSTGEACADNGDDARPAHHPSLPGSPLNGPTTRCVIQPP